MLNEEMPVMSKLVVMMFILSTGFSYKIDILGIRLGSIFRGFSDFQRFMKKTAVIAYLTAVTITLVTFLVCFVFVLFCFDLALWSHFVSQTTVLSSFGFVSFWFRFAQYSRPVLASNLAVDLIRAIVVIMAVTSYPKRQTFPSLVITFTKFSNLIGYQLFWFQH